MISSPASDLKAAISDFLSRSYADDVDELNFALAKRARLSAGLTPSVPPSVLTGDPLSLTPGQCLGVFGINPRCHGVDGQRPDHDVNVAKRLIDKGDLGGYFILRSSYFVDGDPQYYGGYFDRLIKLIQKGFLEYDRAIVRDFGQQAFKLDLLPWWSANTSDLRTSACSLQLEQFAAWKRLVDQFITTLRPVAIFVNSSGMRNWCEELFETDFERFVYHRGPKSALHAYAGTHPTGTPVLLHGPVYQASGPQTVERFRQMLDRWEEECGVNWRARANDVLKPSALPKRANHGR